MGKQRTIGVNNTTDSLGIPDIGTSPAVQQMLQQKASLANDKLFKPEDTDLVTGRGIGYEKSELDKYLPNGPNLNGSDTDIEHQLGESQGGFHQAGDAILRFVPMVGIDLAKSITNLASGVAAGTESLFGNKDAFTDLGNNTADKYLNSVEEELKAALPIYSSTKYDTAKLPIFTSKFWTEDAADGLAFVIAQAIGAKGLGAVAGAAAEGVGALTKAANIGELYQSVPVTQRIASAIANKFTTGTVGFLNAASISAMQAKGTANQIEAKMRQSYAQKINPETGAFYTDSETDTEIAKNKTAIQDKTNNTFWATMATELLPSIYASKLFLGASKAEMGQLNTDIMKAVNAGKFTLEDVATQLGPDVMEKAGLAGTKVGGALLKNVGQSALKEAGHAAVVGSLAMNLQTSIQKYDVDQAMIGNKDGVLGSSAGYARQFLDNFTTNEGIKGLVMGAILGAGTGAFAGASEAKAYNEQMTAHLQSMRASEALFGDLPKGTEKTDANGKILFDENDNPIQDPEKLTKVVFQALHNKNNWTNQTAAIVSANSDMATMNDHVMLAQGIARELQSGRYDSTDGAREYFKWFHAQRVKEQGLEEAKEAQDDKVKESADNLAPEGQGPEAAVQTATAMKTGSAKGDATLSKRVNDSSQLIDKMFAMWDISSKQSNKLTRLGEAPDRSNFNDNVKRSLYYEAVKREAMKSMLLDKEAEMKEPGADREGLNKQTEVLQNLMLDSENRTSDFLSKHDELYEEWKKSNKNRADLYLDARASSTKFSGASTEENARAAGTANYKFEEHADKEGLGDNGLASTDQFLGNESTTDRLAVPIGTRQEQQYKAGMDYMKLGRLNDMMDKVRTGELPLKEAVSYATDNITRMDDATRTKLNELIKEQQTSVTSDEEKLAGIDNMTDDFEISPEYAELEQSIDSKKDAIAASNILLANKAKTEELDTINRGPAKIEETLNKQFAEKQFDKANNVISNAIDENGKVKKEYSDTRSVTVAIDRLTRMRNALEDRTKSGELDEGTYKYLINKADAMLEKLKAIATSVAENEENRKYTQQRIANNQAQANATGLGYSMESSSVSSQPIYNAVATILGAERLNDLFAQLEGLPSGNFYEGTVAILHAVKTKASPEQLGTLTAMIEDQIASLVAVIPEPTKGGAKFKTGLAASPELHFSGLLQSLSEGKEYSQIKLDKGTPLGDFLADNDIDAFQSAVDAMPEDTKDLGISKENMLKTINAYRDIVGLDRVKNLLNSKVDLSKVVADEIKTAGDSSGIVPTAQQEIAIRDGLAWLDSNEAVGTNKFDGWGFLRGIAGTGKTSVTVKWILDLANLESKEIIASAATEHAAGVLAASTGGEATTVEKIMEGEIPTGKKLIVLDEYARIERSQLDAFEEKVCEHNKKLAPADRVRVMILGDPTQITKQRFNNQDIANPASNASAKNIRVINPLTIVYRSDVSAVAEASAIYQANSKPVENISVRSDKPNGMAGAVGVHAASSSGELIDGVKANIKSEQDSGATPRSRVIITEQPGKYAEVASSTVPVMSVYDSQSQTYDEVYIDLDPNDFDNTEKFNTAMYTAASRAKQYTYLKHTNADGNDPNFRDAGLTAEKANNDLQNSTAKTDYLTTRAEEKAMMDKAAKGESINVPKTEAAIEVEKAKTAPEKAADPKTSDGEDEPEIVGEVSSDSVEPDDEDLDPDTEQPGAPIAPLGNPSIPTGGEEALPSIEKGTFEALGGRGNPQTIAPGSTLHYMYTQEPVTKGRTVPEPSVTAFAIDAQGNWIPVSKVFKDEIEKIPKYSKWKEVIKTMTPMQFDPNRFNAVGGSAAIPIEQMAAHKLGEGVITRVQRLTYKFNRENIQLGATTLADHIRSIFKSKFFSPRDAEQDKAKNIVFRIWRNNELSGRNAHKFDGFTPEAGIPYAVINGKADTRDWRGAQFVRLTANALSQESEHYSALKQYRDAAKEVADVVGIEPGSREYTNMVRAAREGLSIDDHATSEGNTKKLGMKKEFTREQFLEAYRKEHSKTEEFKDPLEHLSNDDAASAIAKMQHLASLVYGIKETESRMTPSEMTAAHGDDYEHVPLRSGAVKTTTTEEGETKEPLGYARLKGTGAKTGKPDQYATHWEFDRNKGTAQVAFNQLAKANEYVGGTRIRIDEAKTRGVSNRSSRPTGKSIIDYRGGDAKEWMPRKVLATILGESKVAAGKLSEIDLKQKDTKTALESEIRDMYKSHEGTVEEFGAKLLAESGLSSEDQAKFSTQLDEALNAKDTAPITMKTLDLMVGDENYENGSHLTEEAFNVKNRKGDSKQVRTYLRTPLDIDKFNTLGAKPDENSGDLSKMVGTKFSDLSPTQVYAANSDAVPIEAPKVETEQIKPISTVPADKQAIQDKIEDLAVRIKLTDDVLDKMDLMDEQQKLIDERDSTSRMFDQSQHRSDVGDKITIEQATTEIKKLLPGITDGEINFLSRSMMLELQQPGESLLGLFQKGKLFLRQNEDGTVFSNVVRHEVFHKVYNDYLSDRDRSVISKEFDPQGEMTPLELEEALADRFMLWQKQPETAVGKIKRIFQRMLSWLNFTQNNSSTIDKLFNDIQDGKFQKVDPDTANVRRAFSDISKWGTIADYKNAARFLQNMVYDHFVNEHIDKMPLTQGELFTAIQLDMIEKFNEANEIIQERFKSNDALLTRLDAETNPEIKQKIIERIRTNNEFSTAASLKVKMLEGFLRDGKMMQDMWKDIYPNFSFKDQGIISLVEDDISEHDPEAEERGDGNPKETSLHADYVQSADEKNQETKVSQNVKNFLSFIYRPKADKNGSITRVNPRGVYLLALRNLSNMETSSENFIKDLQERAAQNGIKLGSGNDADLVIGRIIKLYNNATNKFGVYEFNRGTDASGKFVRAEVPLPEHSRFLDEDTFVKDLAGRSIAHITEPNPGEHLILRREDGQSTADFLNVVRSGDISMDQAKGYFRQYQAQETLREVMSNFTSQREAIPMIAEETRDYTTTLKYMRAQVKGEERVQTANIEDAIKTKWYEAVKSSWKEFDKASSKDKGTAIANLMKALGLDGEHVRGLSSNLVEAVHGDIKAFRAVIDSTAKELVEISKENASDTDEEAAAPDPVYTALSENTNMLNRLTQLLSLTSSDNRAGAYIDAKGTKKYLFHNGSQAHDVISRIIRATKDAIGVMPKHLTEDKVLSKNIFASGLNRISSLLDHDGYKQKGREEFALGYSDESNKNWLERNFSYGFLSYLHANTSNNDGAAEYVQPFYTISNRPRMNMATVEVLPEVKLHEALIKGIEQHVEQPDTALIKNYDRFKAVNFDEFHKAIRAIHGEFDTSHTEGRVKAAELYDKIAASPEMKAELASHMIGQLKELSEKALQRMKKEGVVLGSDASKAMKGLKDPRRQILTEDQLTPNDTNSWPSDDEMRPVVESYYMNNYVNSYFLNQAVAGNMNYFKNALDMVKRMSGVFAPGTKGLVGKFFMNDHFNVAVASDPKMTAKMLSPIFEDTELKKALAKEGFDLADAQGFMTQSRADNIIQGFGKNYKAGAVFKPAHYENVPRTLEDDTVAYVPVMLKYSSVVLSEDLISRFPKLKALNGEMVAKGADEFVFNTGVKLGAPVAQVELPGTTDYGNENITIDSKSVVKLSNENYRLQLNPTKDAYSSVANPTQLGYFLNVMHNAEKGGKLNMANADRVYQAVAAKMARGIVKLGNTVLDAKGAFTVESIKRGLTGPGNERIQEMLGILHNLNMPNAADKALIQMAGIVDKAAPKIEFPGGKLVLQSSYGMDIPPANVKGHDVFWSKYGTEERAKLEDTARRLEYKQEPNGRWYAEVMLPKIYASKANPGDFVLPDAMGFRIPSTELHSSVPLKVVGFYDDKGSNVVVAPAELVAQHGSDFDVDSLSVITRELASSDAWENGSDRKIIDKAQPIGYYRNADGKYEFDINRFLNHINGQKELNADNPKFLAKLEKLHDQALTNQITEAFLDTISHEDNKDRMLTPISVQVITDTLKELGIEEDKNVNLSRLEDNLKVYNSNFQGASLTGVFANGPKALSYLSRAGKDGAYPELQQDEKGNPVGGFDWNGQTYDKFTEQDHEGGNLWAQLDSFINTAVDNVKDQYLSLMNATDKTGPAFIAAKAMGMPLKEVIRMMRQPVIRMFSEQQGGKQTSMDNLKKAIVAHAETLTKEDGTPLLASGLGYSDLRNALKDNKVELNTKYLDSQLGSETLGTTPAELAHQIAVLDRFEKVNQIGQDLSTFSSAISILQNMPVFYEDVQTKVDQWNALGGIKDGKLTTNTSFSFNIDNLLQAQPNIAEAYNAFQFMKTAADKTLIKHFPEMSALVNTLADSRVKILTNENANRERIKNEVVSYLISTHYADELKTQEPVTVGKKKNVILTGKNAWSQEFTVEAAKAIKEGKDSNAFFKRLAVKKGEYGDSIRFANSSNPDAEESLEMQEAFNAIPDEKLKQDFVKYAVLNFGLNFGMRNYSMFIPPEYLKPISEYISGGVKKMVTSSGVDENNQLTGGPLANIRDNIAIKMAVNNPDKLPFISAKKHAPIQTTDAAGKAMTIDMGDKIVPVLSGYDGSYYWHRAYDNPEPKAGKELTFPEFIKQRDGNGRDVVYRRLNNPEVDSKVYYQRVAYKNFLGGYDGSMDVVRDGYNPDDYFAKGTIPVPVADIRTEKYEARNEHIKEGSRVVVYPYSNATREQGISGIVDKVTTVGDKQVFTLQKGPEFSKQLEDEAPMPDRNQDHLMNIATKVAEQAGLKLETSDKLPAGVKGTYQDGTVTLNPKLITADTVFHEVSHPLIAAIKEANPAWYQNLSAELHTSPEGRTILSKVNAKYPELSKEGREVEALVTAVGMEAANRLPESKFRGLIQRLLRSIGNMVRTVLGQSAVKSIDLASIGSADMAKLSIGDIADLLAGGKVNLREVSSDSEIQYSKDLNDQKPVKNSIMERLLELGKSILDPVRNEFGQEADTYTVEGKDATRVSRAMDDFTFREKKETLDAQGKAIPAEDAIAQRDADRMFKDAEPGSKLIIDGVEKTKEEYQAEKKQILLNGIAKGNIIHAKIQRFLAKLGGDAATVSELDSKIEELSSKVDKLPTAYDWVTKKGIFDKLMRNAGVNIGSHVAKAQEDKIFSEVKVVSPILGIAGKIDMMVEKPDGRLRIVDWKTGSKLKDKYSSTILKYGYQQVRITDNPLDRAKLQVMLYALTVKAENPEAKFDGLVVMHLPNELDAVQGRNALAVEIPSYLKMLEQYYKHEKSEIYKQLLEKSPNIFDPREYNAPLRADFAQEVMNSNGKTEAEVRQSLAMQLQQLEFTLATRRKDNPLLGPTAEELEQRANLVKMIGQANDYYGIDFNGALDPNYEITLMKRWAGTLNDTKNPLIQAVNSHLKVNEDKAYKELAKNYADFDRLLLPVIKERIGVRNVAKKALSTTDYKTLFENFYSEVRTTDPETGNIYVRRGMTNPSDHAEAYAKLSPAEKALSDFMRKNMADVYDEVMTKGSLAIVGKDHLDKPITKQDVYNASRRGANFQYSSDFFPKLVVSKAEVTSNMLNELGKGNVSAVASYAHDRWLRFATDFFDNNAEGYNQKDYGLPVRYLGNNNTSSNPDAYSMDMENGYKKFMEQMIRKKHLDSTYMYGQAVKGVMENTADSNGNPAFKQAIGFLEYQMSNILLGDTLQKGKGQLVSHGWTIGRKEGKEKTLSFLKMYRSLKSVAAAGTLWIQPQRSFVNAAQAGWMHGKEALVNDAVNWIDKAKGLQLSGKDISLSSHLANYKEAWQGQYEAYTGQGKTSFIHQLAKEFRLYGNLEEEGGKHSEYLTKGSTLLDSSNFGLMYKVPEEVANVQYALSYLKNLEIKTGKYKGKSMYDMYKENFNKTTGQFELPSDFTRGTVQKGDGTVETLSGLHALEINKIHAGIGKIMGNYRKDEKTALQGSIIGDAFMMFKRWIPGMANQQYQSKFLDPTLGSFELKQKDGEDVYEWRSRVVEGRMRVMGNVLMSLTGLSKFDGYAWSDLSVEQKKGLIDTSIALGTWTSMLMFGGYAFNGMKQDDTRKKLYDSMKDRVAEQVWLPAMLNAAIAPPAVIKKTTDTGTAIWQVLTAEGNLALGGSDKNTYTERGDIRGMNQLMKNVPFLSSYYETKKSIENWETETAADSTSPF